MQEEKKTYKEIGKDIKERWKGQLKKEKSKYKEKDRYEIGKDR